MKETFRKGKSGEKIPHKEYNKLTGTVQRLANQLPGSNLSGIHTDSFSGVVGYNPWHQFTVEISNTKISESDVDDSGLYLCTIRYYDHTETGDDKWKARTKEWLLDASDLGATLVMDDKLTVWWDQQRRAFIPCAIPTIIQVMLKTSLVPDGTADAYPIDDDGEIIDEEWTIEVTDTIGDKRASGKDDVDDGNGDGAKGFVKLLTDGSWAIVEIHQLIGQCTALLTEAVTDTDASVTIDNVVPIGRGQSPLDNPDDMDETIEASIQLNPSGSGGYTGADNTPCVIEYHEAGGNWWIYDMPCEA